MNTTQNIRTSGILAIGAVSLAAFYDGPSMEVMMHGSLKRRGYHIKGNSNARYDGGT